MKRAPEHWQKVQMYLLKKVTNLIIVSSICFAVFIVAPVGLVKAGAENYRQCQKDDSCEIGEFLFDDEYAPITNATCTLTANYPDDTVYLNSVALTAQSDGWYSTEVTTAGNPEGLYRSQICCTSGTDYLCIDKSFEIVPVDSSSLTTDDIANEVWSYPTRSLSTFGTLVSDVWSYSSRSLNNVTSLITSIWTRDGRSLDNEDLGDGSHLATSGDINSVKSDITNVSNKINSNQETLTAEIDVNHEDLSDEIEEIRNQLDLAINEPVIQNFIEEFVDENTAIPEALDAKIEDSRKTAHLLRQNINDLQTQVASIDSNWNSSSEQVALIELEETGKILGVTTGQDSQITSESIAGQVEKLGKNWDAPVVRNLEYQTTSVLTDTSNIAREIRSFGKNFLSKQYLDITKQHLSSVEKMIGEEDDEPGDKTLFGYLNEVEENGQKMSESSAKIAMMLDNWDNYDEAQLHARLNSLRDEVIGFNRISGGSNILKTKPGDKDYLKNLVLSMRGVIDSNFILLIQEAEQPVNYTWIEYGSLIFKTLVSNPSAINTQTVEINYYLPKEVKEENIINLPEGLTALYVAESDAVGITGSVTLAPGETRTIIVEVEDIWTISEDEINLMRKQVDLLFEPLKGTSYFAQGSVMKAEIDANLDRIAVIQENTQTPGSKIRAYREARIEMESAQEKMESLKGLVSSASSVGSVFGFVGGVQTVAVWGLIVVLLAGFVFLALYIRLISSREIIRVNAQKAKEGKTESKNEGFDSHTKKSVKDMSTLDLIREIITIKLGPQETSSGKKRRRSNWIKLLTIVVLSTALLTFMGTVWLIQNSQTDLISPLPTQALSPIVDPSSITPRRSPGTTDRTSNTNLNFGQPDAQW